jgi:hypothetical protein
MQTGMIERQGERELAPPVHGAKQGSKWPGREGVEHLPLPEKAKPVGQPTRLEAPVAAAKHAELDAMLQQDPNTGAMNGLRWALLLNAGLAVTGLLIWEVWAMLAV